MKRRAAAARTADCYAGAVLDAAAAVDVVDAATMTPADFHRRYVTQRKPCVLTQASALLQGAPNVSTWTLAGLAAAAGECEVEVEVRDSEHESFGLGKKQTMTFGAFVAQLEGQARLYMTTQSRSAGPVSSPATALVGTWFPRHLALAGALVLANLNMWIGAAPAAAPTRTPLHHDFHDNFYLLVRGRKRFSLFSPADALRMRTRGRITRVHANGLINYEGAPQTNGDGSTAAAVTDGKRRRLLRAAQQRLRDAEAAGDEALMDAALEALLDHEAHDDYADDAASADEDTPPLHHFCTADAEAMAGEARCAVVDLVPGQMLFLPAGWFHQVESSGAAGTPNDSHCAVNWWYHPPDCIGPDADFARPYTTDAWSE